MRKEAAENHVYFKELKNSTLRNIYFSVPLYGNEISILRKSDTHRLRGTEKQVQDILLLTSTQHSDFSVYNEHCMIIKFSDIFFISQYHCNLSEDIQQSCLTITTNGM